MPIFVENLAEENENVSRYFDELLAAAAEYIKHHISIFQLSLDASPDLSQASDNIDVFNETFTRDPDSVLFIATGSLSGLCVIDCDIKNGQQGPDIFEEVCRNHGAAPSTCYVKTPSGGVHYYYRLAQNQTVPSATGKWTGVDVHCEGGCIVAPPSQTSKGQKYQRGTGSLVIPQAPFLPDWLYRLLLNEDEDEDEEELSGADTAQYLAENAIREAQGLQPQKVTAAQKQKAAKAALARDLAHAQTEKRRLTTVLTALGCTPKKAAAAAAPHATTAPTPLPAWLSHTVAARRHLPAFSYDGASFALGLSAIEGKMRALADRGHLYACLIGDIETPDWERIVSILPVCLARIGYERVLVWAALHRLAYETRLMEHHRHFWQWVRQTRSTAHTAPLPASVLANLSGSTPRDIITAHTRLCLPLIKALVLRRDIKSLDELRARFGSFLDMALLTHTAGPWLAYAAAMPDEWAEPQKSEEF